MHSLDWHTCLICCCCNNMPHIEHADDTLQQPMRKIFVFSNITCKILELGGPVGVPQLQLPVSCKCSDNTFARPLVGLPVGAPAPSAVRCCIS